MRLFDWLQLGLDICFIAYLLIHFRWVKFIHKWNEMLGENIGIIYTHLRPHDWQLKRKPKF